MTMTPATPSTEAPAVMTAVATRPGTEGPSADAAATFVTSDGAVCAAVVDGIGHSPATVRIAPVLAEVAARAGAVRGPLAGLLAAALLVEDPGPDGKGPNAVAVAAIRTPGGHTIVAWCGDARAYGWNGQHLRCYTTDHTVGQQLRLNGAPLELAEEHDNWIRVTLANAVVSTVYTVMVPTSDLLVLTSDGVHDQVGSESLEHLVRTRHAGPPQALADALVAAAEPDSAGYRDDATVCVVTGAP